MSHDSSIIERMKAEQQRVFRIATDPRRYGLSLKSIAMDADIPMATLATYSSGHSVMPITALHKLVGVIPAELLSLLLPEGFQIAAIDLQSDEDEFLKECGELVRRYAAKRSGNVTSIESELDARLAARRTLRGAA